MIDPDAGLFFFISSDPPPFRKAKALAVEIENFEAGFLKHNSFVDTTTAETFSPEQIAEAYADPDRQHGLLIKTVRQRIRGMVASHEVLAPDARAAVLAD